MSREWEITIDLTDEEFKRALSRYWRRRYGRRCCLVLVAVGAVAILVSVVDDMSERRVAYWCASGLVGLIEFLIYFNYVRANMARRRRSGEQSATLRFGDAGVSITTADASSNLKWRLFQKLWKWPETWLLFFRDDEYFILPVATLDAELRAYIDRMVRLAPGMLNCRKCGYDLRGLAEARCPECGDPFEEEVLRVAR